MRLVPLLLALALLAPAALPAQQTIRPGDRVQGELSAGDPTLPDGTHYDLWSFRAQAGRTYLVYLTSDDFDAYAAVGTHVAPICRADCLENDDGAGGTNAVVPFTPSEAGTYLIRAGSYRADGTGAYTLTLEDRGEYAEDSVVMTPLADTGAVHGMVTVPETDTLPPLLGGVPEAGVRVPGRLGIGGEAYDTWIYFGEAGETITVTLQSGDFDPVLRIRGPRDGGWEQLAWNDDGVEGRNSAATVTLPAQAVYLVEAGSFRDEEGGRYTVLVTRDGAGPVDTPMSAPATALTYPALLADTVQEAPVPARAHEQHAGELTRWDRQDTESSAYFDLWSYTARAGESATIRLRSDAFDTVVAVGGWPDGAWQELGSDDDGGSGTNSSLTVTFPADGEYLILARALAPGETGRYTLSVESH